MNEAQCSDYIDLEVKRGQIVLFDSGLIHSSTPNISPKASFALVGRFFDITTDQCYSASMSKKPYDTTR